MSLSMLVTPSSFQYAIFEKDFSVVSELCHMDLKGSDGGLDGDRLDFLLQNHSLSGQSFARAHVACLHGDFALLPSSFAAESDISGVLAFTGAGAKSGSNLRHHLTDVEFCYRNDSALMHTLERALSNATVRHAGAVTILAFGGSAALAGCNGFMNVHHGIIEIALRENGDLLFYNTFAVSGDEDILYYLLFSAEQFSIKPQSLSLALAGQVEEGSQLAKYLARYCGQVTFAVSDPSVQMKGALRDLPTHRYFTLLNQHLCAL